MALGVPAAPSPARHADRLFAVTPAARAGATVVATAVETPVTRLSIRLLGGFRAERAGKPLDFRRKKGQALLAYLALRPGVEHSREALAGLLWAGTTDEHARHNLRQTLFALRQALPIPLVLEGETIGLRDASVEVDVAAFERGRRRSITASCSRDSRPARRRSTTGSPSSGSACGSWRWGRWRGCSHRTSRPAPWSAPWPRRCGCWPSTHSGRAPIGR